MSTNENLCVSVGINTKYILSTSGRLASLNRYNKLLETILSQNIVYLPFSSGDETLTEISPQKFASALRSLPCIGGAISKDIKHGIIPYLDEIDESAEIVKSVNTVLVRNGKLIGYNTDMLGFRAAIQCGINKSQQNVKSAVCYGYGGVVSVVVHILKELGLQVYIIGRNLDKARMRANEMEAQLWESHLSGSIDLFINAAPVTDQPLELAPNFLESVKECKVVFDHELNGKYLRDYCDENSIFHIPGTAMYYPQMVAQWSLFLDFLKINDNDMRLHLAEAEKL